MKTKIKTTLLIALFSMLTMSMFAVNPKKKDILVKDINTEAVWTIVKYALAKEGINLSTISCDNLSAQSQLFEYKFLMSDYMGRYLFTLEDGNLTVKITDVHFKKDGKWESTSTSLAFAKEKKLRKNMVKVIEKINDDEEEIEKAKNTFLSAFDNDFVIGISSIEREGADLIIGIKVKYTGSGSEFVGFSAGNKKKVISCDGTEYIARYASMNGRDYTKHGVLKHDYTKDDMVDYKLKFKDAPADLSNANLYVKTDDFKVSIAGLNIN